MPPKKENQSHDVNCRLFLFYKMGSMEAFELTNQPNRVALGNFNLNDGAFARLALAPPSPLLRESVSITSGPPAAGNRVLIVGAGLCGTYLAWRIRRAWPDIEVQVLERGAEPGGRMLSRQLEGVPGVVDLGAGRFNRKDHPSLAALVDRLHIGVEPFGTRDLQPPSVAARVDIGALLQKVIAHTERRTWCNTPFLDLCHARLSSDELDRLLSAQGYDVLLDDRLPTSEAVRILNDHPETTCHSTEWLRLRAGFQELVRRLHQEAVRAGAAFHFDTGVVSVERLQAGGIRAHCDSGAKLDAVRIFVTPPLRALHAMMLPIPQDRRDALSSVTGVPLLKAAFGFDRSWWNDLGIPNDTFLGTTNPLRKVYFRSRQILIYNDSTSAAYWQPLCEERAVRAGLLWRNMAHMLCHALGLAQNTVLPQATQHVACFWPAGVHTWNLGAAPNRIQEMLIAPDDCVHICSEAYSPISGWGEAALQSAERALLACEGAAMLRKETVA